MAKIEKARGRPAAEGIRHFLREVGGTPASGVSVFLVTHLLPDRPFLVEELSRCFALRAIYPKPKSASQRVIETLSALGHNVEAHSREAFDSGEMIESISALAQNDRVILLDIGGYFAEVTGPLQEAFDGRLLGVVEDTENGVQRYERQIRKGSLACPVMSVARSPLKETEDYLVGQAVIHSAEHVIRLGGQVLGGKAAIVFGFGKVGRSIATNLRTRGVDVRVIDTDPIRQVQALSLGFSTITKEAALATCDLIVGATGERCIEDRDWFSLKPGAFVFTVTSSDDELDVTILDDGESFDSNELEDAPHLRLYSTEGTYFYLLNKGNAVNFLHNAVVGDFIYLVQAEIIRGAKYLLEKSPLAVDRIWEVADSDRADIADAWLRFVRH